MADQTGLITSRRRFLASSVGATVPAIARPRAARRPNILFAIADDQTWLHTPYMGERALRAPALERVGAEGVVFTHAFCSAPACAPSRAAILTGKNFWELGEAACHLATFPRDLEVYPDILERRGYFVGMTNKGWGPGRWKEVGWPRNPAGTDFGTRKTDPPYQGISSNDYAGNFQEFLAARPQDKPFCFWFGPAEPHVGWHCGIGLLTGHRFEDATVPPFLPDTMEVRGDLLDYYAEIEWYDWHLGRMLKMLEDSGELDNTIVVATADNGMPFPRAKSNLYDYGARLPLAIRWREGAKGGRRVDAMVSFIDFAPTFLEAAGIAAPPAMRGRSLVPLLQSSQSGRIEARLDRVYFGKERHAWVQKRGEINSMRGLRTREHLYIRHLKPHLNQAGSPDPRYNWNFQPYGDVDPMPTKYFMITCSESPQVARYFGLCFGMRPAEELYSVAGDPANIENLADRPESRGVLERMRADLDEHLKATGDPRALGRGELFERAPYFASKGIETPGYQPSRRQR